VPYAYVTTPGFLRNSGSRACAICRISKKLADAGLLGRTGDALGGDALAAELRGVLGLGDEVEEDLGEEHVA
jgi:hypothetical protein